MLQRGAWSDQYIVDVFTTREAAVATANSYVGNLKWETGTDRDSGRWWTIGNRNYDNEFEVAEYELLTEARPK